MSGYDENHSDVAGSSGGRKEVPDYMYEEEVPMKILFFWTEFHFIM